MIGGIFGDGAYHLSNEGKGFGNDRGYGSPKVAYGFRKELLGVLRAVARATRCS